MTGPTMRAVTWVLMAMLVALAPQTEWNTARPDYEWSFPRDHGPHPGFKTEWWYFTGLLEEPGEVDAPGSTENGPALGYQFTIFKVGVLPEAPTSTSPWSTGDLLMGHLAVTDLRTGTHTFEEVLYRAAPPYAGFGSANPGDTVAWSLAPPGTAGRWTLGKTDTGFSIEAMGPGLFIDLALDTASAKVFQGPGGFSRKSDEDGRASMYYSYTDLVTSGVMDLGNGPETVSGLSWMDHEFSSDPLEEAQIGWDWFSLRLGDQRAVMAFQLRDSADEAGFSHLTVVQPDRTVSYPDAGSWSLAPGTTWASPATDAEYPVEWTLQLPGEDALTVSALDAHAENVSERIPGLFYWEGPVQVSDSRGRIVGRGYLEMTGYGEGSRPAL